MNYMYSLNATGNSQTTLIVNFDVKTDPNTDLILAQSRETQAASQLPIDVTNYGITVRKSTTAPLMLVAVYSPHGTYDARFLAEIMRSSIWSIPSRARPGSARFRFRSWPVRNAVVGQARSIGQNGYYRHRDRQRYSVAKHGKSGGTSRRRTDTFWAAIRVCGPGARAVGLTRGIR